MRTKEKYFEGLSKMKRNLYYNGEKIGRDNEDFTPSYNIMGTTFELAANPEYEGLMSATWPAPAKGVLQTSARSMAADLPG